MVRTFHNNFGVSEYEQYCNNIDNEIVTNIKWHECLNSTLKKWKIRFIVVLFSQYITIQYNILFTRSKTWKLKLIVFHYGYTTTHQYTILTINIILFTYPQTTMVTPGFRVSTKTQFMPIRMSAKYWQAFVDDNNNNNNNNNNVSHLIFAIVTST